MICIDCLVYRDCDIRQKELGKCIINLIEKNFLNNNQPEHSKREDICYHIGDINSCCKCDKSNVKSMGDMFLEDKE